MIFLCSKMIAPYYRDDWITIYNADCHVVMPDLQDSTIDLVHTDPPYKREFLYTYDYLANDCPRLMKRGASLITIVGHFAIPDVIKKFDGKLKYRWMFCMNQFQGTHARMAMGIEVMWKPILWYVKEAYPQGRGFIKDGFIVSGKDGQTKERHEWEQDSSWANYFISKLTSINDTVLDPFLGSGTVAVTAKALARHCVGIEIDEKYCEIAAKRCSEQEMGADI